MLYFISFLSATLPIASEHGGVKGKGNSTDNRLTLDNFKRSYLENRAHGLRIKRSDISAVQVFNRSNMISGLCMTVHSIIAHSIGSIH